MLSDTQWEKLRAAVDAVCNRETDVLRWREFQIERGSRWIKILLPDSVWDLEPEPVEPEPTPYWIEDLGHAWFVVHGAYLRRRHPNFVPSSHSYFSRLRNLAYLEEDVDAEIVIRGFFEDADGNAHQHSVRQIDNFDDYVRRHGLERFPA